MIKVPLSWLKDYVDLIMSPEELAAGLTLRGLEVGGVVGADTEVTEAMKQVCAIPGTGASRNVMRDLPAG